MSKKLLLRIGVGVVVAGIAIVLGLIKDDPSCEQKSLLDGKVSMLYPTEGKEDTFIENSDPEIIYTSTTMSTKRWEIGAGVNDFSGSEALPIADLDDADRQSLLQSFAKEFVKNANGKIVKTAPAKMPGAAAAISGAASIAKSKDGSEAEIHFKIGLKENRNAIFFVHYVKGKLSEEYRDKVLDSAEMK
ncbi:MAG: hypothetical protein KDB07_04175 [Planctomycetes bacterium]|nr:hypothetical protein [Planctomycetota bacterium]